MLNELLKSDKKIAFTAMNKDNDRHKAFEDKLRSFNYKVNSSSYLESIPSYLPNHINRLNIVPNLSSRINFSLGTFVNLGIVKSVTVVTHAFEIFPALNELKNAGINVRLMFLENYLDARWRKIVGQIPFYDLTPHSIELLDIHMQMTENDLSNDSLMVFNSL